MCAWLRRWVGPFALAALFLAARAGQAGDAPPDEQPWRPSCQRVKDVPFPAADQPDGATALALRGCNAESLFYGIGQVADRPKARLCAYVERAAGDGEVFGGSAILMTIYATGDGARRDADLAIHLACGLEGAPAEMQGRVQHLENLKRKTGQKLVFDLCDDITSGFMMGHCAAHQQRITEAKREQRYAARLATWTAPQRDAFKKLRQAASDFFAATSGNENDMSGTARAEIQIEQEEGLEKSFIAFLDQLERGKLPAATAADLAAADRRLNAVYKKLMNGPELASLDWGTVTKDGIRQTERTWPGYRDAWAALAEVKFPRSGPDAVKVRLTQERTDMLKAFLPNTAKATEKTPAIKP